MERYGELRTYPGRTVPVAEFIADVEMDLYDANVVGACADGYKSAELRDLCPWDLAIVRTGSGPDGSAAVRAFQTAILTRTIRARPNVSLTSAIAESTLYRNRQGNPSVERSRSGGRIDVLSAAVLSVGASARWPVPAAPVVCVA